MSLQIHTTRIEPDIVVVQISGSITSGSETIVEPLVNDLLDQTEKKLIFDLTSFEKIDSTGANIIIQCYLMGVVGPTELESVTSTVSR